MPWGLAYDLLTRAWGIPDCLYWEVCPDHVRKRGALTTLRPKSQDDDLGFSDMEEVAG